MNWTQIAQWTEAGYTNTIRAVEVEVDACVVRTTIVRDHDNIIVHDSTAIMPNTQVTGSTLVSINIPVNVVESVPVPLA